MKDGRLEVGDVLRDWTRGDRVVVSILRPEDLHRFSDDVLWRGSVAERCALHGASMRRQDFGIRD